MFIIFYPKFYRRIYIPFKTVANKIGKQPLFIVNPDRRQKLLARRLLYEYIISIIFL